MSLATRCRACGTLFRVVQDQLKVSEGWVRCGRCQTVFNALDGLFDLERESPPPWPPKGGEDAAPRGAGDAAPQVERPQPPSDEPAPRAVDEVRPSPADIAASAVDASGVAARGDDAQGTLAQAAAIQDVHDASIGTSTDVAVPSVDEPPLAVRERVAQSAAEPPAEVDPRAAVDPVGERLFPARDHGPATTPAELVDVRDRHEFSDARFDSKLLSEEELRDGVRGSAAAAETRSDARATEPASDELPSFARENRMPQRRRALGVAAAILVVALALQAAHQSRASIAANGPAAAAIVDAWCAAVGCSVETPRRIESVSVESSALRASANETFRLSVVLRNSANVALAMPSLDLTLTDSSGQLVARRVIVPSEWAAGRPTLAPSGDTPLDIVLATGTPTITGYKIDAFYP